MVAGDGGSVAACGDCEDGLETGACGAVCSCTVVCGDCVCCSGDDKVCADWVTVCAGASSVSTGAAAAGATDTVAEETGVGWAGGVAGG